MWAGACAYHVVHMEVREQLVSLIVSSHGF